MRTYTAIRKSVKWSGALGVVLLVAVWGASGWLSARWSPSSTMELTCHQGMFSVNTGTALLALPSTASSIEIQWGRPATFFWRFRSFEAANLNEKNIPLWWVGVLIFIPTALAWQSDRRATSRARIGHCPACDYDRHGLSSSAACPECGSSPPLR